MVQPTCDDDWHPLPGSWEEAVDPFEVQQAHSLLDSSCRETDSDEARRNRQDEVASSSQSVQF